MKSAVNRYFKYTGIIVIAVLLGLVYGYRYSQPVRKNDRPVKASAANITTATPKKMVPGAACCKVSFSRAKMLSVKNAHSAIIPAGK